MDANVLCLFQRRITVLLGSLRIESYLEDWRAKEISFILREPVSIGDTTVAQIKNLLSAQLVTQTPANNSFRVVIHCP